MLLALTKPKYYIPIGGTIRHMRAFGQLAEDMGAKPENVLELLAGESIEFSQGSASKGKKYEVKSVLVDGLGIGDVGKVVLRDRNVLAKEGIAIAIIQFDTAKRVVVDNPEIISRGFVFNEKQRGFLKDSGAKLRGYLDKKRSLDKKSIKDSSVEFLERHFYKEIGRRPMVLPVIVEV
jgi:ribonuclease J